MLRSSALALAVLVGTAYPSVQAQEGQSESTAANETAAAPTDGSSQLEQANSIKATGEALASRLQGMLKAAREAGDIVKVTCLNDKLTQANANLRTVSGRVDALKRAVEVNDTGAANHEFTVISVLGEKFRVLSQEASQCVGQDLYEPGAAQVVTTVEPGTTTIDPTTAAPSSPAAPPSVSVPPPVSGAL